MQEIKEKSEPIETGLQVQQLRIDDMETQFLKDLGSNSHLESLLQEVVDQKLTPMAFKMAELEDALSKYGDENPAQSTHPLKLQEAELQQRLRRLESSIKRAIEGGQDDQEATSKLLNRGDLIKRRLDELETHLEAAGSGNTSLVLESLARRLDDVDSVTNKVSDQLSALNSKTMFWYPVIIRDVFFAVERM